MKSRRENLIASGGLLPRGPEAKNFGGQRPPLLRALQGFNTSSRVPPVLGPMSTIAYSWDGAADSMGRGVPVNIFRLP